jgi:glycosyltransferase involved in cell wall biosynthesis
MIFAESDAIQLAGLWPMVRRFGLADRFTLIPDLEARRELSLRGDILCLPDGRGEFRSLTLDAMAAGMLVIAAADPMISVLLEGRTARLIDRQASERWASAVTWALEDRESARRLAASAREFVRTSTRASSHVAAVVDAYEWMTSRESIPFQPPA